MGLSPLIPDPNAPQMPQMQPMAPAQMPQFGTPLRPLVTSPRNERENALESSLAPQPAQHPQGFWQNVRHIAARIGNIAGDIAAPGLTAMIPDSDLNKGLVHESNVRELAGLQSEDRADQTAASEDTARGVQAGEAEERTSLMPGQAADAHALSRSEVNRNNAEGQPKPVDLAQAYANAVQSAITAGRDPSTDPVVSHLADAITNIQKQPADKTSTPEQQYLDEYAKLHPGSTVADAERHYALDTQRPPQSAPVNLFVPGTQPGTETLQTVRPGQTVAAGAQTAAGLNAVNTPTMQQRTAAGRAQTVVAMAPEVLGRIDSLAPKLGPVEGRWNEFMQGKIGTDDPDFAALRSDLLMMSSAVALAHAQGRLPENLRVEFDRAINAPKQTPANLKATIQTMIPWLQKMQEQGHPNEQQGGTNAPPAGAKIIKWDDVK